MRRVPPVSAQTGCIVGGCSTCGPVSDSLGSRPALGPLSLPTPGLPSLYRGGLPGAAQRCVTSCLAMASNTPLAVTCRAQNKYDLFFSRGSFFLARKRTPTAGPLTCSSEARNFHTGTRTFRRQTLVPPRRQIAQGKHHPLAWNIGSWERGRETSAGWLPERKTT